MDSKYYAGLIYATNKIKNEGRGFGTLFVVPVFDTKGDDLIERQEFETWGEAKRFKDCVNSGELDCLYDMAAYVMADDFADADAVAYGEMV